MSQYRILHKKDGYYPQKKGWWRFWSYYINNEGHLERFSQLSECEAFLERESSVTKVIPWEPKCNS